MALLELKDIKKNYQQGSVEIPALKGIDLMTEKGEFITIYGSSGSGKTTILNIIACLDKPTSGKIYFNGSDMTNLPNRDRIQFRRQNIGIISRNYKLIPVLTVYENVEFALKLVDKYSKMELKDRVVKILTEVGLAGLEKRRPAELTPVQKQRLVVARALVKEPELVLADQPTANLDCKSRQELLEVMVKMNEELGTTFIIFTHESQVLDYAFRVLELSDGLISHCGQGECEETGFAIIDTLLLYLL